MKRSREETHSDSDETRLSSSSEASLIIPSTHYHIAPPRAPISPLIVPEPVQERRPRSSRSSIMMNLCGSVRLAPEFDKELLPAVLRGLQVYYVVDRSVVGPYLEPENDGLDEHYVVKRLVDETLSVSAKTIENYFRIKEDDSIKIGFVVHSKRFPQNTSDYLSPSNEYLLIRLDYLKDWYKNSLKVKALVRTGRAERWIDGVEINSEEDV
tara:strand:- start:2293 stop:2925 length:633 start_codon:yes stop_codon:yes gene_type:complete